MKAEQLIESYLVEVTREFLVKLRDNIELAGGKIKDNTKRYILARFRNPSHAGEFAGLMAINNPNMYIEVKKNFVYLYDPAAFMESDECGRVSVVVGSTKVSEFPDGKVRSVAIARHDEAK